MSFWPGSRPQESLHPASAPFTEDRFFTEEERVSAATDNFPSPPTPAQDSNPIAVSPPQAWYIDSTNSDSVVMEGEAEGEAEREAEGGHQQRESSPFSWAPSSPVDAAVADIYATDASASPSDDEESSSNSSLNEEDELDPQHGISTDSDPGILFDRAPRMRRPRDVPVPVSTPAPPSALRLSNARIMLGPDLPSDDVPAGHPSSDVQDYHPRYSIRETSSRVEASVMKEIRDFMRLRGVNLSSFLNSLSRSTNPEIRQDLRNWGRSAGARGLMSVWQGGEDWAVETVEALINEEVLAALNKGVFTVPEGEQTNAHMAALDLDALGDTIAVHLPTTVKMVRALVGPDDETTTRKSRRPGADADPSFHTPGATQTQATPAARTNDSTPRARSLDAEAEEDSEDASEEEPLAAALAAAQGLASSAQGSRGKKRKRTRRKRVKKHSITVIISQGLYCRRRTANRLHRTVGVMLYACRVPVKAIEVMFKFGLCQSYATITNSLHDLAKDAREALHRIVGDLKKPWGLLYDNINYVQRVKYQSAGNRDEHQSAIVGNIIVLDHNIALPNAQHPKAPPEIGCRVIGTHYKPPSKNPYPVVQSTAAFDTDFQKIPQPDVPVLTLEEVLPNASTDRYLKGVFVTHLINGFLDANPSLERLRAEVPKPPAILPLQAKRSTLYPLPLQRCNEATVQGNISYFKRILQHVRYNFKNLQNRIIPVWGDLFTVERIRQAKDQMEDDLSDEAFDKFQFPEPFMGPFHLMMAVMQSFFLAHGGDSRCQDAFSLYHGKILLDRKTLKMDKPEFHEGDQLIRIYVGALSYLLTSQQMPTRTSFPYRANLSTPATPLSPDATPTPKAPGGHLFTFDESNVSMDELVKAATAIAERQFDANIEIAAAHDANIRHPEEWDAVYLHGSSLLRHALIYTELRHCVKHGDPGRMKALFPYLIPILKATNRHHYSSEMLEVLARWKTQWSNDLGLTLLCHSLVNQSGRPDGWIGIDLWQEHDVRLHKVDFPISDKRGPSEKNLHDLLGGIIHTLRSVKLELLQKLGIITSTSKAAAIRSREEIWSLARDIYKKDALEWQPGRQSTAFRPYPDDKPKKRGDKQPARKARCDPLQEGIRLLTSGPKSLWVWLARRAGELDSETDDESGSDDEADDEAGEDRGEVEITPSYPIREGLEDPLGDLESGIRVEDLDNI